MILSRVQPVRGFSLIELVIVVVIIGIIAAIAIPRMSRGTNGAWDAALSSNLAVLRNAIDLYKAEHGALPTTPIPPKLLIYTDINGNTNGNKGGAFIYGPYLQDIPPLPVGSKKGADKFHMATNAGDTPPGGDATKGWWFNSATGEVRANLPDTDVDDAGTKYNTY